MGAKRQQILITVDSTPNSDEPLTLVLVFDSSPKRGQPIHGRFVAAGGTGGYVITLKDHTSLPDGVTFDSLTGELSGTPTAMGRTAFIAGVQDSSASESDPTWFSIDVLSGLKFGKHLSKYIGQVNVPLNALLPAVQGATGSITWTLDSGSFHSGLDLVGAAVTGTPLTPGGITYASLLATDAGSGDTLPLRFITDIREGMVDIAPDVPVEVLGGIPTTINLMEYFTGGVGPFRMEVIADSFPPGLELVRTPGNDWFMTGVPVLDAYEGDDLWSPVGVDVFDALGAQLTMAWEVLIRNPINSIGTMFAGVPTSDRTASVLDFQGSAVKAVDVEPDLSKTTVVIEPQADAFSVLGRSGATGGDAANITAATNNRILARVSNVLTWTQVTMPMISATGTAGSTNFLRGDGSWNQVTVATISATGTPGASKFLCGDGSWSAVTAAALGSPGLPTLVFRGDGSWAAGVTGTWSASSFKVGSDQVVGARVTGFAAATGTADKATYATYATPGTISNTYSSTVAGQLTTALAHLQVLSRQVKALKDALIAHGLIGT